MHNAFHNIAKLAIYALIRTIGTGPAYPAAETVGQCSMLLKYIPCMYKFSRDANFVDKPNLGFLAILFHGLLVITPCVLSVLLLFYKLISWMTS